MWERVSTFVRSHRRRIAGLVLVLFVLVLVVDLSGTVPRETQLSLDLGEDHDDVRELVIEYSEEGELVHYATRRFADGAPRRLSDHVDLLPGHYAVRLGITYEDGHDAEREGEFDAPADGTVVVSWGGPER